MKTPEKFLTRRRLDTMGCDTPGCTDDHSVLFFRPICHPSAGCWVRYNKLDGLLTLACRRCDKFVAQMLVAADAAIGMLQ